MRSLPSGFHFEFVLSALICVNQRLSISDMPETTYLEAIRQGLWEEMERDPAVFCIGEDIGIYGGAFKVTEGFVDRFGPERIVDTPIAESAIVGAAFRSEERRVGKECRSRW